MGQPAIRVEGVAKSYRVGSVGVRKYRTLQESIIEAVSRPAQLLKRNKETPESDDTFWALRDVSFEVEQGDVTGLIGINGAGKSTLLKILSQITQPTRGRSAVRGRVASLLEVGTGFHQELTGRENVLLNGAILGMKRHEILSKFDRIVEFAGVERFVDTPVKRYSSGMYLRLAFAVAAHLDPEVLLVDEVLAVGDIAFQQRCIGRMREVSQEGRTVVLVSHNLVSIEALCGRCLLLDAGRLVQSGPVEEVTREYRRRFQNSRAAGAVSLADRRRDGRLQPVFTSLAIVDEFAEETQCFPLGGTFCAAIGLNLPALGELPEVVVRIEDSNGQRMMTIKNPASTAAIPFVPGPQRVECRIDQFPLTPGEYWIGLAIYVNDQLLDSVDRVMPFSVVNSDAFGDARGASNGVCIARSNWAVLPNRPDTASPK